MPRGGSHGRGGKRSHKGQRRHFTTEEELKAQREAEEKQRDWRRQKGFGSDEEEEEAKEEGAVAARSRTQDDIDDEYSDSDDEGQKAKGVSHLIEIENPNRIANKSKKISQLDDTSNTQLSRREREEIEKQQAKERYQKLHMQGKTDEARADLARLAIIRKQREEAAKKRAEQAANTKSSKS